MIPNVSSVEYNLFERYNENDIQIKNFNINYLSDSILNRIKELKSNDEKQFSNFFFNGLFNDPDGPFEGGLDDIRDWAVFIYACIQTFFLSGLIIILPSLIPLYVQWLSYGDIGSVIIGLFMLTLNVLNFIILPSSIIELFGDAFDIIDPNNDGY
jgi:hypothetical protein